MDENTEHSNSENTNETIAGAIRQTSEAWNPFIDPPVDEENVAEVAIDQPEIVETRKTHPRHTFSGEGLKDAGAYESKYSRYKQAFLKNFINKHIDRAGGEITFAEDRPYIFIDMYGGLGLYRDRDDGEICAGSPILFYTELEEAGIPYKGLVYEKNANRANSLKGSLYHIKENVSVIHDDNANFFNGFKQCLVNTRWDGLHDEGRWNEDYVTAQQRQIRGLVYLDFTGCCDVDKIVNVCHKSHMDVLIHHGNTPVKRCEGRGGQWDGKSLTASAISNTHRFSRRYWYTSNHQSAPCNKQQFNFLYGTNTERTSPFMEESHRPLDRFNMYNIFDHEGQLIRLKLTHSNKTLKDDFKIEN
jgi:hypothetical protein